MSVRALTIRGPFRGPTGYDRHVRETAKALDALGVAVELIPLDTWSIGVSGNVRGDWLDSLVRPVDSETVVHIALPTAAAAIPGKRNVNFTMFEADRIADSWLQCNAAHDLVVVPTDSSRDAWIHGGYPKAKLRKCPLAVDARVFSGDAPPLPLRFEDGERVDSRGVRFLNISELGSRKNLTGLMRAWLLATTPSDDAALILKVGCYFPGAQAMFEQIVATAEMQARKNLAQAAPVCFVYGKLPEPSMPRLFTSATHYISMSLGEGWDFPMMEAAASGLRLIAPEHSGYTEYLDASIASMIPARAIAADCWGDPQIVALFAGARWWLPEERPAVEYIREAIARGDGHKQSARERIATKFTWTNSAVRLLEIVDELQAPKKSRWSFAK